MICFSSFLRAQQDSLWTAGNRMIDMDNETDFPVAETLPTSTNGFGGAVARYATNVQYDEEGNLLFFIIDGRIYDEDGEQIADSELDPNCQECLPKGMHDVSIVKRPGTCDEYFIFWGHNPYPGSFSYGLEMAALDLNIVSEEGEDNCGAEPSLVNWTDLWFSTANGTLPSHPFYEFINQQFPNGIVSSDPDDPDVANDPLDPDYGTYGNSVATPFGPNSSIGDYTITIPTPTEDNVHTTRVDFDIIDGNVAGEKILFVMSSKRLVVYRINNQGVFFEEDFTTPGNDFESDFWDGGRFQFIAMEVIIKDEVYHVAISEDGGDTSGADDGVYDPDDDIGRNLYYLTIDPVDYTILSEDKIDTHMQLENGNIGDLTFSTEGDYLYFNTEYEIVQNGDLYLYYLDIGDLLNGSVNIGSVPTTGLSDYDRLQLASAQIMAHEFNGEPSIYYVNKDGAFGYLCVLEGSDDPVNSTYHHNEILLGPIGASLVDGGAGFQDNSNNYLNFYALNKQNFAPQQAEELAMEECCEWQDLNQNEVIEGYTTSANEDWDADNNPFDTDGENTVTFCDDLVFEDGANISIDDMNFIFTDDAEMVLEAGAFVYLDGSLLTSVCEKMWPGVTVEGDYFEDQFPTVNGDQGYLKMVDGSTIENAIVGVKLAYEFTTNPTITLGGGIFIARDSYFYNNQRDVQFNGYVNMTQNGEYSNVSEFDNCVFETNKELNDDQLNPLDHILMSYVSGIVIEDCSFLNTTDYGTYGGVDRGNGITAFGTEFKVTGQTDLYEDDNDHTSFYKLHTGISANNGVGYICAEMAFQSNVYGIYNTNTDNPEIYDNKIYVPHPSQSEIGPGVPVGTFFTGSTGYKVTRNDYFGVNDEDQAKAIGCRVDNSGGNNNYVYKNYFDRLSRGVYVERTNRAVSNQKGLQVLCNDFEKCAIDFYIAKESTVRHDQGGNTLQHLTTGEDFFANAGNRFSYAIPNLTSQKDVAVNTDNTLYTNYWAHDEAITIPDYQSINGNLNLLTVSVDDDEDYQPEHCANEYYGHDIGNYTGGGGGPIPDDDVVIGFINGIEEDIVETEDLYKQTVDQNSTDSIIDILDNAYSDESGYLRDLLLQKYPLSNEVLKKMIEQGEKLDEWHLTQVFVANAPIDEDVLKFLIDSQLLSDFYLDMVRDAKDDDNLKDVIELQLRSLYVQRDKYRSQLSREYLYTFADHTVNPDSGSVIYNDAFRELWENYPNNRARINLFLNDAEFDSAQTVANNLPNQEDILAWKEYATLAENLDNNWLSSDSTDIDQMKARWADRDNPMRASYLGLLYALHKTKDSLEYEMPTRSSQVRSIDRVTNESSSYLNVYPNPMSGEGFITYPTEIEGVGTIKVTSIEGRHIDTVKLDDQNGLISISTKNWTPGMYLVTLFLQDKKIETKKITVVH